MPTQTDYRNQYKQRIFRTLDYAMHFCVICINTHHTLHEYVMCSFVLFICMWVCVCFFFHICLFFLPFKLRENWKSHSTTQYLVAADRYTFRVLVIKMLIIWFICQYKKQRSSSISRSSDNRTLEFIFCVTVKMRCCLCVYIVHTIFCAMYTKQCHFSYLFSSFDYACALWTWKCWCEIPSFFHQLLWLLYIQLVCAECARRLFIFDMHSGLIKLFKMFSVN